MGEQMPITPRTIISVLAVTVLASLAAVAVGGPAQADVQSEEVRNYNGTQRCLDMRIQDHRTVQLWSCSGAQEQRWIHVFRDLTTDTPYAKFVNLRDNVCLESPILGDPGENVFVAPCRDSELQGWRVFYAFNPSTGGKGWYQVWQNMANFLCLYLPDNRSQNGNRIEVHACDKTDPAQQWRFANQQLA
jgi:hypothetical protein